MKLLRISYRFLLFISLTLIYFVLYLIGFILFSFSSKWQFQWRNQMVRIWAKHIAWGIGMRIHIQGKPPKTPFILVSNHLSYLDIVLFFSQLDCVFIAKKEVRSWPLLGLIASSINTLFIDRTRKKDIPKVNLEIQSRLNQQQGIIFFPEGTTSLGNLILPFKPSLLEFPAKENFPVHYSSIHYQIPKELPIEHVSPCWVNDDGLLEHLYLLFQLPFFDAHLTFGKNPIQHSERKILAQNLRDSIQQIFTPTQSNQEQTS
ncbi:MAG: 1-acyl-sn-glycerol-3-phosphate acyltransferase [bacterium]|jgi:1-acyl-sn-glycerol-3-phosphate acyltransferase